MEYVYAALILNESGEEINEENLTNVIDAAGVNVEQSRVKALVAALEDVDIDQAVEDAAAVPAAGGAGGAGGAPDTGGSDSSDDGGAPEEEAADEGGDDDEDDGGDAGEGLGELFG